MNCRGTCINPKDLVTLRARVLHGIASDGYDQTHVKSENPRVAQCKFSALSNSLRRFGTLFGPKIVFTVSGGINDLPEGARAA
jgi:hypothetical protein